MRAAIYARVSTQGQAERQTIESQLLACRDYCAQHNYEIVGEFLDDGVSGSVPLAERPAGARLLASAPERVVIYCPDRLGRNITEALLAVREFKRLHIVPEFVLQSFDDAAESQFSFHVFLAVAELERATILRRMNDGRRRSVRNGNYVCNQVPYGYRRDEKRDDRGQRIDRGLSIHAQEADVIRRIYAWCIAGDGLSAIRNRLRDLQIPPPTRGARGPAREWSTASIHRFLTDRRYIGKATYGLDDPIPMSCPPIIDDETFHQAQEALAARKLHSGRPAKYPYLLQGKLFCRRCGSRFYVDVSHGKALYYCSGVKMHRPVPSHAGVKIRWRAEALEGRVRDWVARILDDQPEQHLKDADVFELLADQTGTENEDKQNRLQAQLDRLNGERQRLIDLRVEGHISHDDTVKRLDLIESQRSEVMAELRALQESPPDDRFYRDFAQFLREVAAGRASCDETVGRRDVDRLIARIWVEDNGDLSIDGKTALSSQTDRLPATCTVAL